ncbi:TPA: hypothetical protein ACH3X1_014262 [Trebouxia sp. C0004]
MSDADTRDNKKRKTECRHCGKVVVGKPYKMKEHLSLCDQASNSDRMEADSLQISNAASASSQPAKITSFVDRVKITAAQKLRFSTLLSDLFSKYFDADSVDAASRNVVQDSITTDLDFHSKVFEPNYASQPAASPLEHTQGGHTDSFDVRQFVARC